MKNIIALLLVLGCMGICGCKKDYSCQCTYTVVNQNGNTATSQSSFVINDTKSNSKELCDENDGSATYPGYTTTIECNID